MAKLSIVDEILTECKPNLRGWYLRLDDSQRQQLDDICEAIKPGGKLAGISQMDIAKSIRKKFGLDTSQETIARYLRGVLRG